MPNPEDIALLQRYANGDEAAFTHLVERYIHLVYSTSLRQVGNPSHAEEISQAVFILLTRKAKSISPKTVLSGWLYQTARLTAANFLRSESSRQQREQQAYMQSTLTAQEVGSWSEIAPLLEEAVGRLRQADRDVIVLRFFENKTSQELATLLGLNEVTARKRVSRALERLRNYFSKRGVDSTASALAQTISGNAIQVAPDGLAKSVAAIALANGAGASVSTLSLIKGALNMMAWTKTQATLVAGAFVLLAAGTTTVLVAEVNSPSIRDDDPVWKLNPESLAKAPHVVLVRLTHFHDAGGRETSDTNGFVGGRFMPLQAMMACAYDWPLTRMAFSSHLPFGPFDYLITVRDHPKERFQAAIKRRFGVVGKREMRDTDAFLLDVKTPGAAGITANDGKPGAMAGYSQGCWLDIHNAPISKLAGSLEGVLGKPVFDETGLTNRYNTTTKWIQTGNPQADEVSLRRALLDQLGLELAPTNMPVETLVVERAK